MIGIKTIICSSTGNKGKYVVVDDVAVVDYDVVVVVEDVVVVYDVVVALLPLLNDVM